MAGKVVAVCISEKKGTRKRNVGQAEVIEDFGLKGDAHAGKWHRQVSLLALESIQKMKEKGIDAGPGDFAENITTEGLRIEELRVGTRLKVGDQVVLQVTQIGKVCHSKCEIYKQVGDCIMPVEGVFSRVVRGGIVKEGQSIEVLQDG